MNRSCYKGHIKVQKPSLLLQVYEGRCITRNFHSMWQGGTVGARLVAGFVSFPMCLCHCEYLHKWVLLVVEIEILQKTGASVILNYQNPGEYI
jgi:hypothetical protein